MKKLIYLLLVITLSCGCASYKRNIYGTNSYSKTVGKKVQKSRKKRSSVRKFYFNARKINTPVPKNLESKKKKH